MSATLEPTPAETPEGSVETAGMPMLDDEQIRTWSRQQKGRITCRAGEQTRRSQINRTAKAARLSHPTHEQEGYTQMLSSRFP